MISSGIVPNRKQLLKKLSEKCSMFDVPSKSRKLFLPVDIHYNGSTNLVLCALTIVGFLKNNQRLFD